MKLMMIGKKTAAPTLQFADPMPNNTGSAVSMTSISWSGANGSGGTNISSSTAIGNGVGKGETEPIPSDMYGGAVGHAQGFFAASLNTDRVFCYTSKIAALSINTSELVKIEYYAGSNVTSILSSPCVKVGGQWYLYDEAYTQTTLVSSSSNFDDAVPGGAELATFNIDLVTNSKWKLLTFTSGSALSVAGSPIAGLIPAGAIEEVGVYLYKTGATTQSWRWDCLMITAN